MLRVEGDSLLVQRPDGKEVRVHLDETTQMFGIRWPQGERVEARMDKQGHALSIRLAPIISSGFGAESRATVAVDGAAVTVRALGSHTHR